MGETISCGLQIEVTYAYVSILFALDNLLVDKTIANVLFRGKNIFKTRSNFQVGTL